MIHELLAQIQAEPSLSFSLAASAPSLPRPHPTQASAEPCLLQEALTDDPSTARALLQMLALHHPLPQLPPGPSTHLPRSV